MELQEVLQKRRSLRKFTEEAVGEADINCLLHAAMSGPSACNKQPWEFYVVTNPDKMKELKGASKFTKYDAPLAIIVCGNLHHALPMGAAAYWIQDCSAATENILLCATDLGLGAVWCGIHPQTKREKVVQEMLSIPTHEIPLNVIFIGHPTEDAEAGDWYDEKHVHRIK